MQDRLSGRSGLVTAGCRPAGPAWKGRNKPHRGDRRWVQGWSPEQIANRLPVDFPDDESMRISHEAIYQALYVQSRGALKRELVACLRTGRALRVPRARARQQAWAHVTPEVMISERPAEADDRAVPGHWEGDLIIGLERSAIGTLVERTTRFTMLLHLPREDGYGATPRTKNGPALAGYGAITMQNAIAVDDHDPARAAAPLADLGPGQGARRSTPSSRSTPASRSTSPTRTAPGSAARTRTPTGFLRQYFPKGTDLSRWSAREIDAVAATLNTRPRKTLGWKTPAEASRRAPTIASTSRCSAPPVESGQYAAIRYTERLADAGALASIGTVGDLTTPAMRCAVGRRPVQNRVRPNRGAIWRCSS